MWTSTLPPSGGGEEVRGYGQSISIFKSSLGDLTGVQTAKEKNPAKTLIYTLEEQVRTG